MISRLRKEFIVAEPGFNRWRIPPASIGIHLCIGSVYAWSIFNPALVRLHGVAASAADDWTLSQVVWIFTVAIVCLGLSAAVAGRWLEQVGPRMVGTVAAVCWGGGFLVGGIGILQAVEFSDSRAAEQPLPLVYEELRRLAAARMAQVAAGHTLQGTALVRASALADSRRTRIVS